MVAGLIVGLLGGYLHWGAGLLLAIAAGVGKEVWDRQTGKGIPEWQDAAATTVGGLVGVVLVVFAKALGG